MSFKSMESVLNLFNNNKPLRKQYSKESVIYSTELVNDMRKISKYDAFSKEFDDNLARISDEIDMISYSVENYFNSIDQKVSIATSLKEKYSVEMMNFYIDAFASRSTETVGEKAKATGKAIVKTIWEAIKRIFAFLYGLIKKLQAFITRIFIGRYVKTYKEFKAENFTNIDAEISVRKLNPSLTPDKFGFAKDEIIPDKIKDKLGKVRIVGSFTRKLDTQIDKKVSGYDSDNDGLTNEEKTEFENKLFTETYQKYFGTDEKPKAEKMTVGAYLHINKPSFTPKMLEILSEKSINEIKQGQKTFEDTLKKAKEFQKEIEKFNKDNKTDDSQTNIQAARTKLTLINLLTRHCSVEFTCIEAVLFDVDKAIRAGLKEAEKAKEDKAAK